ncbi:serine hydrolase [Aerosakkonemataceae cyanobacterium BLCC-F154]|uniref:Serine hydrolase n=1 Tax=Floridaenema fluviatile BLCC-F154 TaxID=3153640 RepID=A0ABV4Y776_9CYAN
MAAFDKRPKRRQRRQQTKQQQAPQRQQQSAKTPNKRSGSSGARQMLDNQSSREPRSNQPRQRSTAAKSGNWWEKLFEPNTKPPARRVPKANPNLDEMNTPARYSSVTEFRPRNNPSLPNLRQRERNLEIIQPLGRQSPVSRNGRYEFRENGYKSTSRPISPSGRNKPRPQKKRPLSPLVYGTRLLILGIGLGVFVGTLLSILDPATRQPSGTTPTAQTSPTNGAVVTPAAPDAAIPGNSTGFNLTQEISGLKSQISTISGENLLFTPGVFAIDLETGNYVDVNGDNSTAAASTIKVPILIAFLQDVEAGKIKLSEKLTLKPEMRASGSGNLRHQKTGTEHTAAEVVTRMITISDNTATNMAIDRLGGIDTLNQRFQEWGLTTTMLRNPLPDVKGTNTSSPKELAVLMARVMRGELLSEASRNIMIEIMQRTENNELLPKGIGEGAKIAHKTGNIGAMLADVGIVNLPSGKAYVIAVMVKRPRRDAQAEKIIQQISSTTYEYFNQTPQNPPIDSPSLSPNQVDLQPRRISPTRALWLQGD